MLPKSELWHEASENDDLQFIAASYGIKDWRQVYDHPRNAELRKRRPSPHILAKGDRVWIPEPTPASFPLEPNRRHRLVLYPPTAIVQIFLRDEDGEPIGGVPYEVWIAGRRHSRERKLTREDGLVFEQIPLVREAELRVWLPVPRPLPPDDDEIDTSPPGLLSDEDPLWDDDAGELPPAELTVDTQQYLSYPINIGSLNPLNTIEGVQDRLANLGYPCGDERGAVGPQTAAALREFQADNLLPESGTVDLSKGMADPTLARLAEAYGDVRYE